MSHQSPAKLDFRTVIWEPQPAGAAWLNEQLTDFRRRNEVLGKFEELIRSRTGGRLLDWIDHLHLKDRRIPEDSGYIAIGNDWYAHPGALLPPVHVGNSDQILLRVDSVSDFTIANSHWYQIEIQGQPPDCWRTAWFQSPAEVRFGVVERHGCSALMPAEPLTADQKVRVVQLRETLRHRQRRFEDSETGFAATQSLIRNSIEVIGRDLTCELFFAGERDYWQAKNRAGQVQYMRQNSLGLGWGNHDHHTYRSSRQCFRRLIETLELLGFVCREQFYAGAEAGWGAQVLEHPVCGIVVFADVDLAAEEISGDIAHSQLPERETLGTIGLWCALHGEAFFEAGMHHLECQFDFEGARSQLESMGIRSMKPFTDFPFLRQSFTEGERWPVDPHRVERILERGQITDEQATRFLAEGAIGSHLEILERNDGYRGFNQTGINDIIRKTDPRFFAVHSSEH